VFPDKDLSKVRAMAEQIMRHATGEELERRRRR